MADFSLGSETNSRAAIVNDARISTGPAAEAGVTPLVDVKHEPIDDNLLRGAEASLLERGEGEDAGLLSVSAYGQWGRRRSLVEYRQLCVASARRVWPAYLGSVMEFYELMVYINAGPALNRNFFSQGGSSQLWHTLGVWVGHACTFLVRPVGGFLFGWVADTFGRRSSMLATIIGMSAATTLIGCLPTGARWSGVSPYMLLLLKTAQGLFVSGEGPAAVVYSIERSCKETVALTGTSLFASAVYCGILLASLVTFLIATCMSEAAYLSHGWRLPFLTALPLGLGILVLRKQLPETEVFEQEAAVQREMTTATGSKRSMKLAAKSASESGGRLAKQWRPIVFGLLAIAPNPAAAYGGLLFFPTFLTSTTGLYSVAMGASLSAAGTLVGIAVSPVAGALADAYGLDVLILIGALLVSLLAFPLWLCAVTSISLAFFSVVLMACVLAAQGGVYASYLADMFPTRDRAAGMGLAYNVAFAVFGGLTPIVESLVWATASGRQVCSGCSSTTSTTLANALPSLCLVCVGVVGVLSASHVRRLKKRGQIRSHIVGADSAVSFERHIVPMVQL